MLSRLLVSASRVRALPCAVAVRRLTTATSAATATATTATRPRVMVWGGSGALGQAMIEKFKAGGWNTLSVDYRANESADSNVLLDSKVEWLQSVALVKDALSSGGSASKLGAIINTAGGWTGETVSDEKFLAGAERMFQQNVLSSFATVHLASLYLSEGGLCVLTGSAACVGDATPGMISYGAAKTSVHHLIRSVAASAHSKKPQLPKGAAIAGILPVTIDTPTNRQFMPNADFESWTLPHVFASRVLEWADRRQPPVNGGLYIFDTKRGNTDVRLHISPNAETSKKKTA